MGPDDRSRRAVPLLRARTSWKTLAAKTPPKPGVWHHVAVRLELGEQGRGCIYVNGRLDGEEQGVGGMIAATTAPLSLGGVLDGGTPRQLLRGALDEVAVWQPPPTRSPVSGTGSPPRTRSPKSRSRSRSGTAAQYDSADLPLLKDVAFYVIKPYEFAKDGYRFLHGVALAWHKGNLYASFGHNQGGEKPTPRGPLPHQPGRRPNMERSRDDRPRTNRARRQPRGLPFPPGPAVGLPRRLQRHDARAFIRGLTGLNETTGQFEKTSASSSRAVSGRLAGRHAWTTATGSWLASAPAGNALRAEHIPPPSRSAGAMISRTGSLWSFRRQTGWAACGASQRSSLMVNASPTSPATAEKPWPSCRDSDDFGRTWTPSRPSNLPMATSKPCAGTLGHRPAVFGLHHHRRQRRASLAPDHRRRANRATREYCRIFVIRHTFSVKAAPAASQPESHPVVCSSYPCAVKHRGPALRRLLQFRRRRRPQRHGPRTLEQQQRRTRRDSPSQFGDQAMNPTLRAVDLDLRHISSPLLQNWNARA